MLWRHALVLVPLAACYTGAPANRDVQAAWRGRGVAELTDRWGAARRNVQDADMRGQIWGYETTHLELPSAHAEVTRTPVTTTTTVAGPAGAATVAVTGTAVHVEAGLEPGAIWRTTTEAIAWVDPADRVARVDGAALHWGPPNDVNLHWGAIYGAHVGLGRLDTTATPLPSGGVYLGGMLTPTLGLVATHTLAAGTGATGGALGLATGMAAQWWPVNRLWLRAGPAMVIAWSPGFRDASLRAGAQAGASYAFVKVGVLALDLRFDVVAASGTTFGTLGVGVNVN